MDEWEKKILDGLKEGRDAAFKEFVWSYKERFYRVAMGYLKNHEEALDAAQEAFVKIYFSREKIKNGTSLSLWSFRVLTNHCIDLLRKKRNQKKLRAWENDERSVLDRSSSGIQEKMMEHQEIKRAIRKGMSHLSDLQRSILHLRYFGGLSLKEIAKIQGCSIGTVKSSIHRAIRNLRTYLVRMEVL